MPVPAMLYNTPLRYLHVGDELNILCVLRAVDVLLAGKPNCSKMSLPDCPSSKEHHQGLRSVSSSGFYQTIFAASAPVFGFGGQGVKKVTGGRGSLLFFLFRCHVCVQQSVSLTDDVELSGPAQAKHFNKVRGGTRALEPSEAQAWLSLSLVLHSL